MSNPQLFYPISLRVMERWSIYLTYCVMVIGLAGLAGWQWDIDLFRRVFPRQMSLDRTTAFLFFLSGLSFWFLVYPMRITLQRMIGRLLALSVLFITIACLRPRIGANGMDRMTPGGAVCFLFIGVALLSVGSGSKGSGYKNLLARLSLVDLAVLPVCVLCISALIGYIYRAGNLYNRSAYFILPVLSAFCFGMLSFSLLCSNADKGILKTFTGPLTGSLMARRLFPYAFLLPIALGTLGLYSYWYGHIATETGVTLLVVSIIICFIGIIWYNAVLLNKKDAQRRAVEAELSASESRWKGLVSSVKDYAIFLVNTEGIVMSWNDGAGRIKGYRPEEVIGHPISIFYTEEERKRGVPEQNLQMACRNGTHYSEGWRLRKDGSRFWAEIFFTAIYNERQEIQSYVKITRDSTIQKLDREKIAYLARLIEDTSDAIFSTDRRYNIRAWNRAAEVLFGYEAKEVIGRPANEIMRTQMPEDIRQPILRILGAEGYWKGEVVYLDRTGTKHIILLSVSETRDAEGQRDGFVMVCRDVTEAKQAEEQLRQFSAKLEAQVREKTAAIRQTNEELRALASRLEHIREEERAAMAREIHDELGQQLTGLKMDLALIEKKLLRGHLEGLSTEIRETMGLMDMTIQTVRKIATELRPSILDDLGLVAAIGWQSHEFEKRCGIKTSFVADEDIPELKPAVSIGLFRICQESLTNVARHSGARNVHICLQRSDEHLILVVQDDGVGLDPVKKADAGKTLGLLGMKERAFMMGGELGISSTPGEGVTLSVSIPVNAQLNI